MESAMNERTALVDIYVHDASGTRASLSEARITIFELLDDRAGSAERELDCPEGEKWETGEDGHLKVRLCPGRWHRVEAECFGRQGGTDTFEVRTEGLTRVTCEINVEFEVSISPTGSASAPLKEGDVVVFALSWPTGLSGKTLRTRVRVNKGTLPHYVVSSTDLRTIHEYTYQIAAPGALDWTASLEGGSGATASGQLFPVANVQRVAGSLGVSLQRTATAPTDDLAFWQGIVNSTDALSFNNYLRFMNVLFCGEDDLSDLASFETERFREKRNVYKQDLLPKRFLPFTDGDAYRFMKAATEAFVVVNCGVLKPPRPFDQARDEAYFARRDLPFPAAGLDKTLDDYLVSVIGGSGAKTLPYLALIRAKLPDIAIKLNPFGQVDDKQVSACHGILQHKLSCPCLLELIWSYWHEEGMLVQSLNAIARRFQNIRSGARDPLANLEIDPLRPLNNLLWGYIQDEQHRLSVVRRNYEYDHHYGLRLHGKAVETLTAADTRSKFLEAFHNLLRLCTMFFRQDDDTTVKADAFPVLNALKETHLILSQGAHNQFGDLTSTARIEMLMQAWLLARPEFREFLPTRIMVAYPEPWMDRVDAMKKVQNWSDTSVVDFRNLAVFGEQILLSIRYGNWSTVFDPLQAFNWTRFFRPQIQGYSHAYRAVTGVDLATADNRADATLPSVLLQKRLTAERSTT
jgi:hypothetical protein